MTLSCQPTNARRAAWAKAALAVFTAATYSGDHPDTLHPADVEDAIGDLICDLLHFARLQAGMDARVIHAHALSLFEQEIANEGRDNCGPGADDTEILEALDSLVSALAPDKIAPVLKSAGYATDSWLAAHGHAVKVIARARSTNGIGGRHE